MHVFVYLFVCAAVAVIGARNMTSFWGLFVLNILLSPVAGILVSLVFRLSFSDIVEERVVRTRRMRASDEDDEEDDQED